MQQKPAEGVTALPVDLATRPVLGTFVSLKRCGALRSCCGTLGQTVPLQQSLLHSSQRTASDDPRFPAISPSELPFLDLEVWLLANMWAVIARGWSVAASAALSFLLPRWFGANVAGCGEVLLILSLVGIAAMVASFGLPETMIRLVAARLAHEQSGSVKLLVHRCNQLLCLTSLGVAIVTAAYFWFDGFARFHLPVNLLLACIVGVAILALAWQMVDAAILRGLHVHYRQP